MPRPLRQYGNKIYSVELFGLIQRLQIRVYKNLILARWSCQIKP